MARDVRKKPSQLIEKIKQEIQNSFGEEDVDNAIKPFRSIVTEATEHLESRLEKQAELLGRELSEIVGRVVSDVIVDLIESTSVTCVPAFGEDDELEDFFVEVYYSGEYSDLTTELEKMFKFSDFIWDGVADLDSSADRARAKAAKYFRDFANQIEPDDSELARLRLMLRGAARGIPHVMDQIRREFGEESDMPE